MIKLAEYPVIHEQKAAWEDMDVFSHVNNAAYSRYIESAYLLF
ncbi:hypothetical protein [Acinetobacter sp.]